MSVWLSITMEREHGRAEIAKNKNGEEEQWSRLRLINSNIWILITRRSWHAQCTVLMDGESHTKNTLCVPDTLTIYLRIESNILRDAEKFLNNFFPTCWHDSKKEFFFLFSSTKSLLCSLLNVLANFNFSCFFASLLFINSSRTEPNNNIWLRSWFNLMCSRCCSQIHRGVIKSVRR